MRIALNKQLIQNTNHSCKMLCSWEGGSYWWHLPKGRSLKPKMENAGSSCFFLRAREEELGCVTWRLSSVLGISGFMFSECISFCSPQAFSQVLLKHTGLISASGGESHASRSGCCARRSCKEKVCLLGME